MNHDFVKGAFIGFVFLGLLVGGSYFGFIYGINSQKKKVEKPIVNGYKEGQKATLTSYINSAYGVADAAKLYYTESLLEPVQVTKGDVTGLKVLGRKPISGTWRISESGQVILEKVVFKDEYTYMCETIPNSSNIDCEKQED